MADDLERWAKPRLVEEVRRLRELLKHGQDLERMVHEQQTHQEEIDMQNQQLLEMQGALEESRNRYADLYDFAPVAYITLDEHGVIKEINLTGAQLLELERGRLVGNSLLLYVSDEDRKDFLHHLLLCRRGSERVVSELRLRLRSGKQIPIQLSSTPSGSRFRRMLYRTVLVDMRERQKAEDERRELVLREKAAAAQSEAKDRFMAVLSHELRTPLTPVLAVVSALEASPQLPDDLKGDLVLVRRNIEIEARLIDDLLDLTSITRGKLQLRLGRVDLHQVLEEALQNLREEVQRKDLRVEMQLEAGVHHLRGDSVRLQQVFLNLLKNAVKFTPRRGRIAVRSCNRPRNPPAGVLPSIFVSLSDSGKGIDPSQLPRLFTPFEQGEERVVEEFGGLGLGLAIARGLVEAHQGSIRARSDGRGKGATFEVELKAGDEAAAEAGPTPQAPPAPAASRGLRILLVEDHGDTARVLARLLSLRGHEVLVAHSMASALELLRDEVEMLVSDLGLPDGTGLELMREASQRFPRLVGIALSGFGTESDVLRSREAGFLEHLTKPVSLPQLLSAIDRGAVSLDPVPESGGASAS